MKRNENKKSLTKKIVAGTGLALLLALVGYTGANTYAKYTTSAETQTATATVAKWGVVVNASGANAFAADYTGTILATKADNDAGLSVSALDDQKVVAPGTTGEITFSISGKPEVATSITVDFSITDIVLKQGSSEIYNPIKWKLTKTGEASPLIENATAAQMVAAVEGLSVAYIAPETQLDQSYTLTWSWAFSENDAYDTILGNLAVGTVDGYSANLELGFTLDVRVDQVQKAA